MIHIQKLAKTLSILILLIIARSQAKDIYNFKKSYVTPITQLNFQNQIQKIRETTKLISIIQFYKEKDGKSEAFAKEFDEFTNEYKGVFRIGACNCDQNPFVCEQEKIQDFPTFRIYSPVPIPNIDIEGELSTQNILKTASKYIHSNIIEISSSNINTFLSESPSVPKVLLFTDKKGIPMIFKGLSVSFEKKLFFGIVRNDDDIVVQRYNVKKFPTIIVVKSNEPKPRIYSGEMKFSPIFIFLNVYSEVFVPGGSLSADSEATKSWLMEIVPELHQKSAKDICLDQESVLCAILISNGKPEKEQIELLKTMNQIYDRKIERGNKFKFMWLDASIEKPWADAFGFTDKIKLIVLNPGKRKRFTVHEDELELGALKKTFEKINGGDARFVRVENDLPDFSFRKDL